MFERGSKGIGIARVSMGLEETVEESNLEIDEEGGAAKERSTLAAANYLDPRQCF